MTDRPRHISKRPAPGSGKNADSVSGSVTGSDTARSGKPASREEDRAARLAAALRANLRRRKAAAQREPASSENHDTEDPAGPSARGPDED
ncbi:hypothetical protein [Stappia sp. TSB10GB4]|uniref:hypothetical protein n=1 Tax=Stappia sp. TSB10GB4 TaxID=2003584 RepID=UPI001AD94F27|nr:hypothetical protein [Stappia sp. TSB10GB4]